MSQISNMGSCPVDDVKIAFDECIYFFLQWGDFGGKISFKPVCLAGPHSGQTALDNAEKSSVKNQWKYATIGEANLYLENEAEAYYNYLIALEKEPDVRAKESMYIQWLSIVQQKGMEELEVRLRKLFKQ